MIPVPTVEWPASDPLVTGSVGRTCAPIRSRQRTSRDEVLVPGWARSAATRSTRAATTPRSRGPSPAAASAMCSRSRLSNTLPAGEQVHRHDARVPDVAFQASSATGALVYLSLPPDGNDSKIDEPTGWCAIGGTSLTAAVGRPRRDRRPDQGGGLKLLNPALYKIGPIPPATQRTSSSRNGQHQPGRSLGPRLPVHEGLGPGDRPRDAERRGLVPDLVLAAHGN